MLTLDLFFYWTVKFFYCINAAVRRSVHVDANTACVERCHRQRVEEADRLSAVQNLPDRSLTWLVKEMRRQLLSPFVALLYNKSLATGCFSAGFKSAVIRPLLKKTGLVSSCKIYRPVSNLSFLSKLLERGVQVWQAKTWCSCHSPHTDSTTVPRRLWWSSIMTCYLLQTLANWLLSATRLDGGVQHCRPRPTVASTVAAVWSPMCHAPVV